LVDSSVWIDYFNGVSSPESDLLDAMIGVESIAVGDIILTEVLQVFRHDAHWRRARQALLQFPVLELVGTEIAISAAENFRRLRRRGITVRKTVDSIIATYCIVHSMPLLHRDRDFDAFEHHLGLATPQFGA
jgi:predicted nucleic acid-binding protein